jgi:hypothetical protein
MTQCSIGHLTKVNELNLIEYPLSKIHGMRRVSDFRFLGVLEYLHVPNDILCSQDPSVNMTFMCILYALNTQSLKVILYKITKVLAF